MADIDDVLRWLATARWRYVSLLNSRRRIVERLVSEGRAEWTGPTQTRARALVSAREKDR